MTSQAPWDPHSQVLAEEEAQLRATLDDSHPQVRGHTLSKTVTGKPVPLDVDSHAPRLIAATKSTKRKGTVLAETLAKRWQIGLEAARQTVGQTTQLAVRDFKNVNYWIKKIETLCLSVEVSKVRL